MATAPSILTSLTAANRGMVSLAAGLAKAAKAKKAKALMGSALLLRG